MLECENMSVVVPASACTFLVLRVVVGGGCLVCRGMVDPPAPCWVGDDHVSKATVTSISKCSMPIPWQPWQETAAETLQWQVCWA